MVFVFTSSDKRAHPQGPAINTSENVKQENIDAILSFWAEKGNTTLLEFDNNQKETNKDFQNNDTNNEQGTTEHFIVFYNKKQKDGSVAFDLYYKGSHDSLSKRKQIESNGEKIARIEIDK